MSWPAVAGPEPERPGGAGSATLLAALPLVVAAARTGGSWPLALLAGLLLWQALARLARPPRRPPVAAALAVAGTAVAVAATDPLLGATTLLALLAWGLVLGVAVTPAWPDRGRHARPGIAPAAFGAMSLAFGSNAWVPLGLFLAALVVVALTVRFSRTAGKVVGVADKVGGAVSTVVQVIVMVPIGLFLTLLWACHRVVRFDPLGAPTQPDSRWVERDGPDRYPERLYAKVRVEEPRRWSTVAHRTLFRVTASVVVVVGVVWAMLAAFRPLDLGPVQFLPNVGGVVATGASLDVLGQDADWQEVTTENGIFVRHGKFDPVTGFTFGDMRSRWVNVTNGERMTWQPPASDRPRLKVWVFGGSVAWGYFQKDENTLPSQLAKVASEHGIDLEVRNFAMPAWMLGQEQRRFEELLATEPSPPDLAVFYDGANEITQQNSRAGRGEGTDESEMIERGVQARIDHLFTNRLTDAIDRAAGYIPPTADGTDPPLSGRQVGVHAGRRYARNLALLHKVASAYGVPVANFWQPISATAPKDLTSPWVLPTERDRKYWQDMYAGALSQVPSSVVDLSNGMDGAPKPVFADIFHTNDLGARIMAEQVFDHLEPQLQELVRQKH